MDIYRFRLPGFERTFSRKLRNLAYLVILETERKPEHLQLEDLNEVHELTESAGMHVKGSMKAFIGRPDAKHFVRTGKLSEIVRNAKMSGANILIFNVDLSPAQAGNIESDTALPALDRTGLILEIFGRRAQSREGKLQVELAQLQYALPHLIGFGAKMSRLGGGIGTRGPGEKELERDRRKVRLRIGRVKEEIEKVRRHRNLIRSGRKRKELLTVAIVGYTNAGKTMLLNALTGADAVVQNQMFVTLDPKVRMEKVSGRSRVLYVDTVGFIRNLPHKLVESFYATLEEASEADVVLHVLDVSDEHAAEFEQAVEKVLKEISAGHKPRVLALNKADRLTEDAKLRVKLRWPDGQLISAKEKQGLGELSDRLSSFIPERVHTKRGEK
jgi:GTPase